MRAQVRDRRPPFSGPRTRRDRSAASVGAPTRSCGDADSPERWQAAVGKVLNFVSLITDCLGYPGITTGALRSRALARAICWLVTLFWVNWTAMNISPGSAWSGLRAAEADHVAAFVLMFHP